MAPIEQIGSRLVKTFANGKTIVTETVGKGQTLTKVLGADGKVIMERLKVVSDPVKVGKRNVIHTDRIIGRGGLVDKSAVDRVYNVVDGKNVFAGSREILTGDLKRIMIPERGGNTRMIKIYRSEGIRYCSCQNQLGKIDGLSADRYKLHCRLLDDSEELHRYFNQKGLLYPQGLLGAFRAKERGANSNFSLKQMREMLQKEFPGRAYTEWPGMKSLDESVLPKSSLFDYLS